MTLQTIKSLPTIGTICGFLGIDTEAQKVLKEIHRLLSNLSYYQEIKNITLKQFLKGGGFLGLKIFKGL